jgi:hypothetical protein
VTCRVAKIPGFQNTTRRSGTVGVAPDQALTMVEIRARRAEPELRNFGAFRSRAHDGQITEVWMVDAVSTLSYELWRSTV